MAGCSIKSTRLLFKKGDEHHQQVRKFLISLGSNHYKSLVVVAMMTHCRNLVEWDLTKDAEGKYQPIYRKDGTIGFDNPKSLIENELITQEIIGKPVSRKKGIKDWDSEKYYEPYYINWGCKNKEDMFCYTFLETLGDGATEFIVSLIHHYYYDLAFGYVNNYQFKKRKRLPENNNSSQKEKVNRNVPLNGVSKTEPSSSPNSNYQKELKSKNNF